MPEDALTVYEREYPFAWLGILARAAPSSEELIYTHHDRGFALHSHALARGHPQLPPGRARTRTLDDWPDERIWEELQTRMATADGGFALNEGEIFEKGITPMRSFVAEPMRHGRLFLAGDAAHIVPADRRQGPQPRGRRRARARARAARRSSSTATRRGSTATRTAACAASGACSTSRGG